MATAIANVLIIIDAEGLLRDYPSSSTLESPHDLGASPDKYISMIVRQENGKVETQKSSTLTVNLRPKDVIRWRETTLSLNSDLFGLLYRYNAVGGDTGIIKPPSPTLAEVTVPLPDEQHPTEPKTQKISDYFWESTAQKSGNQNYNFSFMVIDSDGKPLGYFKWDPQIVVKS